MKKGRRDHWKYFVDVGQCRPSQFKGKIYFSEEAQVDKPFNNSVQNTCFVWMLAHKHDLASNSASEKGKKSLACTRIEMAVSN